MDCAEVRGLLQAYITHTAGEEEVKAVEEHLCVCNECRVYLGECMDKRSYPKEEKKPEPEPKLEPQPELEPEPQPELQPEPQAEPEIKIEDLQPVSPGKSIGLLEYISIAVGVIVLGVLALLFFKG